MTFLAIFLILAAILLLRLDHPTAKKIGAVVALVAVISAVGSLMQKIPGGDYRERVRETRATFQAALASTLESYGSDARTILLVRPHTGDWPALTEIEQDELAAMKEAVPGSFEMREMVPAGGWKGLQGDSDFALDEEDPEVRAALVNYALTKYITPEVFTAVKSDADLIVSHLPLPVAVDPAIFPLPGECVPIVLLAPAPPMTSPAILKETAVDKILAPVPPGLFESIHGTEAAKKTYDPVVYHEFTVENVDRLFAEMGAIVAPEVPGL